MAANTNATADSYRLPTNVKPVHYDLAIRTDLKSLCYDGRVTVHLDVLQDSDSIQFHTTTVKLKDISLSTSDRHWENLSVRHINSLERATIDLPETISTGNRVQLHICFSADLDTSMTGFYRSARVQEDGALYALTQVQPTFARRAFPCWDEPALKASFSITLVSRVDTVNLSNMPVRSEVPYQLSKTGSGASDWLTSFSFHAAQDADEWKVTKFEKTPPMSTCIVAWANGHLAYLEDSYTSPLSGTVRPLRVYTPPDVVQQGAFTLSVMKKAVPACEELFGIEFALPKLDTLIVPDLVGGLENWGLIHAGAQHLLLDSETADLASKKTAAKLESHEIAHQWFGDLTTMEWWDDLYLNEGFATLVGGTIVPNKIFPEWKYDLEFVSRELHGAMSLDAKLSSHPIEVEIRDTGMINQVFDSLSYDKAASVLRMLSQFVTDDKFLKGVSLYLQKHSYANSTTEDLWEGLTKACGYDIPKMMDNWVKKIGFPVIRVTEVAGGIRVRQDRFLETGAPEPEDNRTVWSIPLRLMTMNADGEVHVDDSVLLEHREAFIALEPFKVFKLNAGAVGMYRVLYSPERLRSVVTEAVRHGSIFSVADRMGIVQDMSALAKAGYVKTSDVLSLYRMFRSEKETSIWKTIADSLATISSTWFEYPDIVEKLDAFTRELFSPIVARLDYEYPAGEDPDVAELRTIAITQAALSGDKSVMKTLLDRFRRMVDSDDDSHVPSDLIRTTLSIAVKHGSREDYDYVKRMATWPRDSQQEIAAVRAMGASANPALQRETWKYVTTKLPDQQILHLFAGLQSNYRARHFLARQFKDDFETLHLRYSGGFYFKYMIDFAFSALASMKDYQDIVEFFEGKDKTTYKLALDQSLDNIKTRSAWVKRSTQDICEWLYR